MPNRLQLKQAFITWLAIYPVITILLWQLGPEIRTLPLAVRTLILTAILVPAMAFLLVPALNGLLAPWLSNE